MYRQIFMSLSGRRGGAAVCDAKGVSKMAMSLVSVEGKPAKEEVGMSSS